MVITIPWNGSEWYGWFGMWRGQQLIGIIRNLLKYETGMCLINEIYLAYSEACM